MEIYKKSSNPVPPKRTKKSDMKQSIEAETRSEHSEVGHDCAQDDDDNKIAGSGKPNDITIGVDVKPFKNSRPQELKSSENKTLAKAKFITPATTCPPKRSAVPHKLSNGTSAKVSSLKANSVKLKRKGTAESQRREHVTGIKQGDLPDHMSLLSMIKVRQLRPPPILHACNELI